MHRILFIVSLLSFHSALAADDPLVIAAGEHGDYSRIVFKMNSNSVRLEQAGRHILVHNIDQRSSYTLSDINDRHKAYRVEAASIVDTKNGKALELRLNCDCTGALRTINGKYLIDIRKAPIATAAVPQVKPKKAAGQETRPSVEATLTDKDRLSVEQAHQQMVALLERAADEGLVKIRPSSNSETAQTGSADTQTGEINTGEEKPEDEPAKTAQPAEFAALSAPAEEITSATDLKCLPDAAFVLDEQKLGDNPLAKISDLQMQLAEATKNQSQPLARKLAGTYLAIGFGEEAMAVLADNGLQHTVYEDMARVIAEMDPRADSALAYAENCDGAHALWQMAAVDPIDFTRQYRRSNGAVRRLPEQLRSLMAARLAVTAVTHEAWEDAQELLTVAREATPNPTPEIQFVEAMLKKSEGALSSARNTLRDVASTNSETTDEAVMALADSYLEDGVEPYEGLTEDIGAVAKLNDSAKTALMEAKAWIRVGNFEAAMLLLKGAAEKSAADGAAARNNALAYLRAGFSLENREKTHVSALDALLSNMDWLALNHVGRDTLIGFVRLARQYGLPNTAFFLSTRNPQEIDANLAYESALSAFEAGEYDEAVRTAAPYAGESRFREIIAKADLADGRYREAMIAAAAIEDEAQRIRLSAEAAWLDNSWRSAASAYKSMDPNAFDETLAKRFAFSAYMAKEKTLPAVVSMVLANHNAALLEGLESMFTPSPAGTTLERSRQSVDSAEKEIRMIEEVLQNG